MKTKLILSMLGMMVFTFTSFAQKGEMHQKKDWDPEKKAAKKVERFAAEQEISEAQKAALNNALVEHYTEIKMLDKTDKESKMALKDEKDKKIRVALDSKELHDSWEMFEKRERMKRKMKKHRKHNKEYPVKEQIREEKQLKKNPQLQEK